MRKFYILLLSISIAQLGWGQIEQVFDINAGEGSSNPDNLFVFGSDIYFAADDSDGTNTPGGMDLGKELWKSDGTAAGTSFLIDLQTGSGNSSPFSFFTFNGVLYFNANLGAGNGGAQLFSSDGTAENTVNANIGTSPSNPQEFNGLIYFINTSGGQGNNNRLNTFDGTAITEVADTGAGEETIFSAMIPFDGKIFCYMNYSIDDAINGNELYAYDVTTTTFSLIKDITGDAGDSSISNFTILGTELYFEALGGLWKTDGTTDGTIAVAAAQTANIGFVNNLFGWDGKLFFEGDDGTGGELWVYDPTLNTVTNLSAIGDNHDPSDYAIFGDFLYYSGKAAGNSDSFLHRTDGVNTVLLNSTVKGIDVIVAFDGFLYFEGEEEATGKELYRLDPTTLAVTPAIFKDNKISVYPNPATSIINVKSSSERHFSYSINDINGRQLQFGKTMNSQIQIDLASGLYILRLEDENNIKISKKFVVE